MKEYLPILRECPLFFGVTEEEAEKMLNCLGALEKHFPKNGFLLRRGDPINSIGLVLSGQALIVQEDFWGNRNILQKVFPGEIFGEAYAGAGQIPSDVSILTEQGCKVLLLNLEQLTTTCTDSCQCHNQLIKNLVRALSRKNIELVRKMKHLSQRSLRGKLMSYLSEQSQLARSPSFSIPFNRQQLADYLSADRSALSAELARMKKDGILNYRKNTFTLFHREEE